jgi:hypothetical protein
MEAKQAVMLKKNLLGEGQERTCGSQPLDSKLDAAGG